MNPDQLYRKLRSAYTDENLNRITARLIELYKQKDHALIREIASRVPALEEELRTGGQKCFSRLVVLYHPDKAGRIQEELRALHRAGDEKGLSEYAHILQMGDIEQLQSTRIDPDIGYDPDFIWDTGSYDPAAFTSEGPGGPGMSTADLFPGDDPGSNYGAWREGGENWDPENWDSPPGMNDPYPEPGMTGFPGQEHFSGSAGFQGTGGSYGAGGSHTAGGSSSSAFVRNVYNLIKMREYGDLNMEFPAYYLEDFEEFELSYSGLTSLEGIQHCRHARVVDLRSNRLEELGLLRGLRFIEELFLAENRISDLAPLSELLWLRRLDVSHNLLDDLQPLMELEHLEYLNILDNPVPAWQIDELKEKGVLVVH